MLRVPERVTFWSVCTPYLSCLPQPVDEMYGTDFDKVWGRVHVLRARRVSQVLAVNTLPFPSTPSC